MLISTFNSQAEDNAQLGGMRFLKGYQNQPEQGIDSKVGRIFKKDGLEIHYEIGTLPKLGVTKHSGQFSDLPKLTPKDQLNWYQEQIVCGQPVHLAHRKDNVLLISFPQLGANFRVTITSPEEMAEALLLILTYPERKEGEEGKK